MKILKLFILILGITLLFICCGKKTIVSKAKNVLDSEIQLLQLCLNGSEEKYSTELKKLNLADDYSYQDIVYLMNHIDSVTLSSVDPFIEAIDKKIGTDIHLEVDHKSYQPFYVTFSLSKPEGYDLSYIYADDTIHLTEFPEKYNFSPALIKTDSKIKLKIGIEFIHDGNVYIGNPGLMHLDGYHSIIQLKNTNGLKLTENMKFNKDTEYIIFAFFKHKYFDFYAKLVWVFKIK